MGTPDFAVPSLEALLAAGHGIAAVVTGADKPRGRGQRLTPTPVKVVALRERLPLLQPASVKDPAFAAALRDIKPDLPLPWAWLAAAFAPTATAPWLNLGNLVPEVPTDRAGTPRHAPVDLGPYER